MLFFSLKNIYPKTTTKKKKGKKEISKREEKSEQINIYPIKWQGSDFTNIPST